MSAFQAVRDGSTAKSEIHDQKFEFYILKPRRLFPGGGRGAKAMLER
jgi:hypothetical protein